MNARMRPRVPSERRSQSTLACNQTLFSCSANSLAAAATYRVHF